MKIRPYVTYFHSSKYMADIANGDICVAVGYSGSFSQAANRAKEAKNGVTVDMRLPKEGAPIWFDMLAIPKGAKNPGDAYTFINYLLQPNVIAPISDFVGYPNPNKDASGLVDPAIRNNPNLYPTDAGHGHALHPQAPGQQSRTRQDAGLDQDQIREVTHRFSGWSFSLKRGPLAPSPPLQH